MLRRRAALALTGLLASLVVTSVAAPAHADITVSEVYGVPPEVSYFQVDGHGWGHGHGMSQEGAEGASTLGKTADQITAFYYPGTTRSPATGTSTSNPSMRVLIQEDTDNSTEVYPATGLKVTNMATGWSATLPTSTGVTRWRTTVDSNGLHLQQYSSSAWRAAVVSGLPATMAGPVQFSGPTVVRTQLPDGTSRDYRGAVRAVKTGTTTSSTVDVLPMESYLLGVVPRESISSWGASALQAQAIAARSYSLYKREHAPSSQYFDICDSTQCQVFGGTAVYTASGTKTDLEPTSTTQAVQATAGVVRTYQGAAIFAEFSASNGGWSVDGGLPYLIAQRDDWDGVTGSSIHSWTATLTVKQIESYFGLRTLTRITVTRRDGNGDWGGRVLQVVLDGTDWSGNATSLTTSGAGLYFANPWPASSDGLRSNWWHLRPAVNSVVTAQSAAPGLVRSPGASTATLTATLRNTGTTTWTTSSLHLALANPAGAADPLVGGSKTPGVYTGSASSVAPGESASFALTLTADGVAPGTYARSYRLQQGTGGLFGAAVNWTIHVAAPAFTGVTVSGPTSTATTPPSGGAPGAVLADGRTVVVPVAGRTSVTYAVRNTGNLAWPVGGAVRLGTAMPHDRNSASAGSTWIAASRPSALAAPAPVAPGGTGTFQVDLNGNNLAVGVTREVFQPLWESQSWISGTSPYLYVVRVNPAVSRAAVLAQAPPSTLTLPNAPTGTAVLVFRIRNVGGSPWTVGQEQLAARPTPLSTSAWLSSTRVATLALNVTRPGIGAVYPGEVGEWRVPLSAYKRAPGTYKVVVQAVAPTGGYGPGTITTVTVVNGTFSGALVHAPATVRVPRTGTAVAYFDVRNTGNTNWPVGGMVRSAALAAGGSWLRAASWLNANRPGAVTSNLTHPGATLVRPGEVARFAFQVAGNGHTGSRSEPFGIVWDGYLWGSLQVTLPFTFF